MASRLQNASAFRLKLETGVDESGKATYSTRSFKDVNASLTDDELLGVAGSLAGLQTCPLSEVVRMDTAALVA
ncbi:DUF1659 domain-containing protein [Anaerovibrio sp.]|uniref:DUF1659 domain-containing protein n=1 Tax=Anaerovibrio sp. TaxID=1872532 RepID=UPI003F13AE01